MTRRARWNVPGALLVCAGGLSLLVFDLVGVEQAASVLKAHWLACAGALLLLGGILWLARGVRHRPTGIVQGSSNARAWAADEIDYYDGEITRNLLLYSAFKIPALIFTAALPVVALSNDPAVVRWTAGTLGAVIVVLEGVQSIFRYRDNWIRAVDTRKKLENEVGLYDLKVTPYQDARTRDVVLMERTVTIVGSEFSRWVEALESRSEGRAAATR